MFKKCWNFVFGNARQFENGELDVASMVDKAAAMTTIIRARHDESQDEDKFIEMLNRLSLRAPQAHEDPVAKADRVDFDFDFRFSDFNPLGGLKDAEQQKQLKAAFPKGTTSALGAISYLADTKIPCVLYLGNKTIRIGE